MKRFLDVGMAAAGLTALAGLFAVIAAVIWIEDRGSPWFRGTRMARGGGEFKMLKFRTMRPGAWRTGVNSTAAGDARITRAGRWLRRFKLDELPQLWNVLRGDMSLVGPRPQVPADAGLYSEEERRMLDVRPGITDLASIVFADEGEILRGSADPDLLYNQIIRPWKSRLALFYVERRKRKHGSARLDLQILAMTLAAGISRRWALGRVDRILETHGADPLLRKMARREGALMAYPPPGAERVVERYRARPA